MIDRNEISVIIVTYNSEKNIKQCLDSISKFSPSSEIIVFDNSSSDNTQKILKSFGSIIKLILSDKNLGFAKANNLASKNASGDFLIFLNPDTQLTSGGSLEEMKDILTEYPDYGLLGPKLILPNNQVQKTVRNLPSVFRAFEEFILGKDGAYDFYDPECVSLCKVESIVGACMVIKKVVFEKVGGFNEGYFLYFEDLDLCKKLKNMGLKIGFYPKVCIKHALGGSGGREKVKDLSVQSAKRYFGSMNLFLINTLGRIGRKLRSGV